MLHVFLFPTATRNDIRNVVAVLTSYRPGGLRTTAELAAWCTFFPVVGARLRCIARVTYFGVWEGADVRAVSYRAAPPTHLVVLAVETALDQNGAVFHVIGNSRSLKQYNDGG